MDTWSRKKLNWRLIRIEALKDTTILILLGAAVTSIALQTAFIEHETGWYEGKKKLLSFIFLFMFSTLSCCYFILLIHFHFYFL